jgi:hypothetical protein
MMTEESIDKNVPKVPSTTESSTKNPEESSPPSPSSTSSGVHSDLSYSSDESSSSRDSFPSTTSSRSRRSQISSTSSIKSSSTAETLLLDDKIHPKVLIPSIESPEDLFLDEDKDEGIDIQSRVKSHHRHLKQDIKVGLDNYTFIRDGDFDIVWPNVFIFAIAHVAHAYSIYLLFAELDEKLTKTWIFSEY